jgi:hypothetical protein
MWTGNRRMFSTASSVVRRTVPEERQITSCGMVDLGLFGMLRLGSWSTASRALWWPGMTVLISSLLTQYSCTGVGTVEL